MNKIGAAFSSSGLAVVGGRSRTGTQYLRRNTKAAAPINGLTPGTMYAIQVRAYGKLGYTDWSDSATRMCI